MGLALCAALTVYHSCRVGAVALCGWFVRNLSFSDGTNTSFDGRGGQVRGYFSIGVLLGLAPQLSRAVDDPAARFFVFIGLSILVLSISAAIWLRIMRWFFSNIRLSCGTNLNFKGNYGMSFWKMVTSMVKRAFEAIPPTIILAIIWTIIALILGWILFHH